eukprot:4693148-Alexandrium_andersonii.AAC.1
MCIRDSRVDPGCFGNAASARAPSAAIEASVLTATMPLVAYGIHADSHHVVTCCIAASALT